MAEKNTNTWVADDDKVPEALYPVTTCSVGEHVNLDPGTKRNIKTRHAQMIAIGGTIGTGLFVGSGQALARSGPAFLFLAYCLMSLMVYGIVTAVIEVATYLPLPGCSMAYCARRYVSPSLGFALGWLYFYSFGIIAAYEITAACIVIDFWPNSVPIGVWITLMLVVIVGLNFCAVKIYAETEFWFAGVKVVMIIGLLFLSFILFWGGGPETGRLGFRYWTNPGATKAYIVTGSGGRFTAFLWAFVNAGFSFFFGPELIVYTAGEMHHPRRNLPMASKRFFWRLIIFYVLGSLAIGVTCSSDSAKLTSGTGNANSSPWVVAIQNAGISTLPSIINAGILLSAWSSGNSYLYMSSRALFSLALQGSAPKKFTRCNRWGVPYMAVTASSMFCLLAYLNVGSSAGTVFNWLINMTNTAGFTSWISCCIIFLRFRKACTAQNITPTYRSKFQPYAAYICIVLFTILLLCNGFTVFYPGRFTVSSFLTAYIGVPVFFAIYSIHRVLNRHDRWTYPPTEIDLRTGVEEVESQAYEWDQELMHGRSKQPLWLRKAAAVLWG